MLTLPKRNSSSHPKGLSETTRGGRRFARGLAVRRGRRVFAGVDIGVSTVKLVELSRRAISAKTLLARTWGVEPLPPGAVETANSGANISDPDAVGEAIRRLRARIGAKARAAALSVPHSVAVTKTLRMDAGLTDEELEVEVVLEAERHIPFSPDETALDFEPSQLCLDDPALVEVDVVACHLEQVRRREAAATAGGLTAAVVELDTAAVARAAHWWLRTPPAGAGPLFVVALGANTATLLAANGEDVVFARQDELPDFPAGATAEDLVRQIVRLVRLGATAPGIAEPARLLLVGGRARTPDLAALAAQRLGLPVCVADPALQPDGAGRRPLDDAGPQLLTACGLAQRGWSACATRSSATPAEARQEEGPP